MRACTRRLVGGTLVLTVLSPVGAAAQTAIPLASLVGVHNAAEQNLGPDGRLPTPNATPPVPIALNVAGDAGSSWKAWTTKMPEVTYSMPLQLSADMISGQVSGEKCMGMGLRFLRDPSKMYFAVACDSKGTKTAYIGAIVPSATPATPYQVTILKTQALNAQGWRTYGGTNPPANCHWRDPSWRPIPGDGNLRPDGEYAAHMYCQVVHWRVEATLLGDGNTIRVEAHALVYGSGAANHPSRTLAVGPLTSVGTIAHTILLPPGTGADAEVGTVAIARQAGRHSSTVAHGRALMSLWDLIADGTIGEDPGPGGGNCE